MAKKKKKKRNKEHNMRGFPASLRKVAIVGKGEGRGLAPRAPHPGYHVWGMNNVALQQPVDMVWDMHNLDWTLEENRANYQHLKHRLSDEEIEYRVKLRDVGFRKLKEHCMSTGTPIMSVKKYEGLPRSYEFPLEKITRLYAHPYGPGDLFSSVVPYMIAYAIYKEYSHIDIFGINCAYSEEWAYQREAVASWANFARGKGIAVTFTAGEQRPGRLESGVLYGYNTPQKIVGVKDIDKWWEAADHLEAAERGIDMSQKDKLIERKFEVWREV